VRREEKRREEKRREEKRREEKRREEKRQLLLKIELTVIHVFPFSLSLPLSPPLALKTYGQRALMNKSYVCHSVQKRRRAAKMARKELTVQTPQISQRLKRFTHTLPSGHLPMPPSDALPLYHPRL
jgi:uncharacterized membrane protein